MIRSTKLFNLLAIGLLLTLYAANSFAQGTQGAPSGDVVMVLPFENTSNRPEYNWVGESFADSLADLLNKPGLLVVSSDERELAYQRLRLPETVIPSRATAIKLAREAKATMVVIGSYSIAAVQGESDPNKTKDEKAKSSTEALVQVTARVIKVNEGRTLGEVLDGGWATRQFDFGGPLTTLQSIHGRLAYQILYQRDKALPYSQNQLVQEATKVPQRAFEAYVKAVLLNDRDPKRENYLKNALKFYADANSVVYPQAAFELGRFYMNLGKWKDATEQFIKLQKRDPHYAEAAFYAALGYAKLGDLGHALAAIVPLSTDVPLIGIYNNAGAIAVQASREEKKDDERARLLEQGTSFLTRAAESSPDDPLVHFNYALALFLSGKYADATEQLKPVITADPRDGQAYFLYAKSLEKTGKTETANAADDQARRYLQTYAKWQTEWQKSQSVNGVSLRMRDVLNRDDVSGLMRKKAIAENDPGSGTEDLLAKARGLYQEGRDDEALPELHRVVMLEPTNAEAYLLSGRINQRRGDQEAAIAALKTAIFWDPRLIDAHILLGRIFLERGDRGEATKFAASAMNLDANNQEAIALQRQVTMGKN
ncbi:MAG: tetratricopeptide repeat protein [Acidobacteriota bacterium]